jgi:hypothetical protein
MTTPPQDIQEIYQKLEFMTNPELDQFCLSNFPAVGTTVSPSLGRTAKINELVIYCLLKPAELARLRQALSLPHPPSNVGAPISAVTTIPTLLPTSGLTPPLSTHPVTTTSSTSSSVPSLSVPPASSLSPIVVASFVLSALIGAAFMIVQWTLFRCYIAFRVTEVVLGLVVVLVPLVLSVFAPSIPVDIRHVLRAVSGGLALPAIIGIIIAISSPAVTAVTCGTSVVP